MLFSSIGLLIASYGFAAASTSIGTDITTGGTITGATLTDGTASLSGGALTGLTTALSISQGGTAATTASGARTNLGLVIGTDVLAPTGDGSGLSGLTGSQISGNIAGNAANVTGTVAAANGGTGVSVYNVGDILYASAATTLSRLGGAAGILHSTGGAAPTWGAVDLSTVQVSNILGSLNGGTGNGFTKFSGPTTSERTFTLPDSSATILTSAAAVSIGQGGTGQTTATAGFNALAPSQATFAGKFLTTNGTDASWAALSVDANNLTGSTLASGVTASSLTSVGTLSGLTVHGNSSFSTTTATDDNILIQITPFAGTNTTGVITNANLSGANKTWTFPNADGTVAVSASGPITLSAAGDIACPTCNTSVPAYALFYGLTAGTGNGGPTDYAATVAVHTAAGTGRVPFPRDGAASGIVRADASSFTIPSTGKYEVNFDVHTSEAGQLELEVNGAEVPQCLGEDMNPTAGGHPIVMDCIVSLTAGDVLAVINPPGNSTALTITPADVSETHANSQTLTIKKL